MLNPDADKVLAIHQTIREAKFKDICRHVYSHRDEKKRGKAKEKLKARQKERREIIRTFVVDEGMHAPSTEQSSDSESDCLDEPSCELPSRGLSDEAHLNNACDKLAKQTAKEFLANPQQEVPPLMSPPYPGTRAMLRIGDTWIMSKYDYHIHLAAASLLLRKIWMDYGGL
jgi:hypothetical protein